MRRMAAKLASVKLDMWEKAKYIIWRTSCPLFLPLNMYQCCHLAHLRAKFQKYGFFKKSVWARIIWPLISVWLAKFLAFINSNYKIWLDLGHIPEIWLFRDSHLATLNYVQAD
jgi:hypothetical protein